MNDFEGFIKAEEMRKQKDLKQEAENRRKGGEATEELRCRTCEAQNNCSLGKKLICFDENRQKQLKDIGLRDIPAGKLTDEEIKIIFKLGVMTFYKQYEELSKKELKMTERWRYEWKIRMSKMEAELREGFIEINGVTYSYKQI